VTVGKVWAYVDVDLVMEREHKQFIAEMDALKKIGDDASRDTDLTLASSGMEIDWRFKSGVVYHGAFVSAGSTKLVVRHLIGYDASVNDVYQTNFINIDALVVEHQRLVNSLRR
jgi:hypothetical protein